MINGKYGLGKVVSVWHDTKWVRVEYKNRTLPVLEDANTLKMFGKLKYSFIQKLSFKEGKKPLTPNTRLFL